MHERPMPMFYVSEREKGFRLNGESLLLLVADEFLKLETVFGSLPWFVVAVSPMQ